jgi:hypothetical protein
MKVLVKKLSKSRIIQIRMILGALFMTAAMLLLPISILLLDVTLMANPYVVGVIAGGMLFFGLVGYFGYVNPYRRYRKMPDVLVETDGEFLYIHGKKEAKIPLAELTYATAYAHLPFLFQQEFVEDIVIHLFSESYGTLELDIDGFGTYKLRFVSQVEDTVDELIAFLQDVMNQE